MEKPVQISVIIITFNEEKNIGRCIDSVQPFADEVVVVDSYSKDRTKQICLEKGVHFVEHLFEGHIQQKNFALSLATFDHVFAIDADEYLSIQLAKSIITAKKQWVGHAYKMNRLSSYGGKCIKHGSWYPDQKIRLWDKRFGSWGGENPHDKVILARNSKVTHLLGDLMHTAYQDGHETLAKIQQYSSIFAKENVGKRFTSISKIVGHTFFSFCKSYFIKVGFLDGFEGLAVAAAEANHVFYKYLKLHEANKRAAIGKRIIISRTDNLGDIILTLPIAGYLKKTIPDSEIYFIGKKYTEPVIRQCTYIDHFLDREELLTSPSLLASIKADTILFVYPDKALAVLAKSFKIPNRVATAHRLFNWFYCNRLVDFSRLNSELHESQLNFKLLRPFRLKTNPDYPQLISNYGLQAVSKDFGHLLDPTKFNLIIHPKSKGNGREWGLDNYYALVKQLPNERFRFFITGLKEEELSIQKDLPELLTADGVHNLMGKFSLEEMSAFINKADGLVASGTGVLHLAAALGTFCVGLFPPIRPIHPGRWGPIGTHATFLVVDKNCSDCKKSNNCECIRMITVSQVASRLLLASKRKDSIIENNPLPALQS
ncbi:MAG: glycosyltransferase [Cytophagales bacterium]|jgi:heptosyltransferase-3|nr:glycosyltransferase [Cytophagales bacterium]MCA6387239.1 glycosyltransferase [Cytophagales bacterium]MCA6392631.1 glycosyltransferase [Cytophagales bacterium]MCA6395791.1 glycosyltransferase [Cytophagales bacterium]MCA6398731.1 glycosyltransferase [Cytophagales bacterium]